MEQDSVIEDVHPGLVPLDQGMSEAIPATSSVASLASRAPIAVKDFIGRLAFDWDDSLGFHKVLNLTQLWNIWRSIRPDTNPSVLGRKASDDALINSFLQNEESRVMDITDSVGSPVTLPSNEEVKQALSSPSEEVFSSLKWASIVNLRETSAYHNMLRFFRVLGRGTYGTVYGVSQRSPEIDLELMSIIERMLTIPQRSLVTSNPHLQDAVNLANSIPNIIAAKQVNNILDGGVHLSLVHEYTLMRELNSIMIPLGVRPFPIPYTVHSCSQGLIRPNVDAYASVTSRSITDHERHHLTIDMIEMMGRNVCGERQSGVMLMELLQGVDLHEADLPTEELNVVYAYLHGILSVLWVRVRFCHGDLSTANIFLNHYNGGRLHNLPVLAPDGSVLRWVQLPYVPMIVDLGMGVIDSLAQWSSMAGPYPSQLCDIYNMYTRISHRDDSIQAYTSTVGFVYMRNILNSYIGNTWDPQLRGDYQWMGAWGVELPGLSHTELVEAYIKSGSLDLYSVMGPLVHDEYGIMLVPVDKTLYPRVIDEVDRLLELFYSLPDTKNIATSHIQKYLEEVKSHYSK